jgi:26S proteasome regulatory subunit N13
VKAVPDPGYIYLYIGEEDGKLFNTTLSRTLLNTNTELVHFCWRRRSQPLDQPDLDLVMIPGDGSFTPYTGKESSETSDNVKSPTTGRIFVLKFSSSPERHLFWLQGKSKGAEDWFSPFDLRLGQIVDMILQGADVNVNAELAEARQNGGAPGPDRDDDDQDEDMEDAPPGDGRLRSNSTTGGAGADATGGDIREEGEDAREGGADGGRA